MKHIVIVFFLTVLAYILYLWVMDDNMITGKDIVKKDNVSVVLDNTTEIKIEDIQIENQKSREEVLSSESLNVNDIDFPPPPSIEEAIKYKEMEEMEAVEEVEEMEADEPEFSDEEIEEYTKQIVEELEIEQNRTLYSDEPRFTEEELEEYKEVMLEDLLNTQEEEIVDDTYLPLDNI